MRAVYIPLLTTLCLDCIVPVWGQTPPASAPTAASQPATQPDAVAAVVNGKPILVREVEERVKERTPAEVLNNPQMANVLAQQRSRYLESLIENRLLDDEVDKEGIRITDEEMATLMDEELEGYLSNNGLSRDEFEAQLLAQRGKTLKEFLADRVKDPTLRAMAARKRLLEKRNAAGLAVSGTDVAGYYEKTKEKRYTRPEQVRASHILISTENLPEAEKAAARNRAELVRAEACKPGADFATLAAQYSACPSRARGGDLGFLSRKGLMTEAFAAAAFALQPGQVSELVESQHGFHIIKVTDRRGPALLPFEQVERGIRVLLSQQRVGTELKNLGTTLRAAAQVTYTPGWEPKFLPLQPGAAASQPAPAPQ